jgi:hypothetical protein
VTNNGGPVNLLLNDGGNSANCHSRAGDRRQKQSQRHRTKLTLTTGQRRQVREVQSGSSYLAQNDLRAHFGIGSAAGGGTPRGSLAGRFDRGHSCDRGNPDRHSAARKGTRQSRAVSRGRCTLEPELTCVDSDADAAAGNVTCARTLRCRVD